MIHIYDEWYLTADANSYTVGKPSIYKNKKTGKEQTIFKEVTYHPTIEMAVKSVLLRMLREEIKKNEINTLQGVMKRIQQLNTELDEILNKVQIGTANEA